VGNDVLDVSDMVTGYDSNIHELEDFVRFATNGSNTKVSVDLNGRRYRMDGHRHHRRRDRPHRR
jgi:hypothetical protein